MAAGFNRVVLMGNVVRDPEVRHTTSGKAVCTFTLAINRRFKAGDGQWKDEATFVDVKLWDARGEAFAKHHRKGSPAFVEGELRTESWEDKSTGAKRSKIVVQANSWEFVGGKREEAPREEEAPTPWASPDPYASSAVDDTPF